MNDGQGLLRLCFQCTRHTVATAGNLGLKDTARHDNEGENAISLGRCCSTAVNQYSSNSSEFFSLGTYLSS